MDKKFLAATAILLSLAWSACTSDHVKRAAYEAAYQKNCVERIGLPDCNPERQSYEEYSKDRERLTRADARLDAR